MLALLPAILGFIGMSQQAAETEKQRELDRQALAIRSLDSNLANNDMMMLAFIVVAFFAAIYFIFRK